MGGLLAAAAVAAVLAAAGVAWRLRRTARERAAQRDTAFARAALAELRLAAMAEERDAALRRAAAAESAVGEAIAARERVLQEMRANLRFVARMSHELRQPLTTVVGFSEVLQGEVFGPLGNERYRSYVAGLLFAGRNLSARLSDLLDLCSIEAGEMTLQDETVEPRDLVAGCLQLFGQRALQRGCLLSFDSAADVPALRADPRRLKQILANLLDDAIERCGEGAEITIHAAPAAGGAATLSVRDPGVAVDFGPGARSGLARALARSLAELHGGRLDWRHGDDGANEAELWLPPARVLAARPPLTDCCSL